MAARLRRACEFVRAYGGGTMPQCAWTASSAPRSVSRVRPVQRQGELGCERNAHQLGVACALTLENVQALGGLLPRQGRISALQGQQAAEVRRVGDSVRRRVRPAVWVQFGQHGVNCVNAPAAEMVTGELAQYMGEPPLLPNLAVQCHSLFKHSVGFLEPTEPREQVAHVAQRHGE
ncbi:MAG: hypothetical protein R2854_15400 [Caldilineaceae bacterium]